MPKPRIDITEETMAEVAERLGIEPDPEPAPAYSTSSNGHGQPFDVEGLLSRRGIAYTPKPHEGGTMFVLKECINDPSHNGKDAAIIQRANGVLCYQCFHNSCSSFGWKQAREKIDPGCYDRRNQHNGNGKANGTKEQVNAHHSWEQVGPPLSLEELEDQFPELPPAIIHGLLREGETANIIAASKVGKSWLMYEIGLCVATGKRLWETYGTVPGDVLLIDNELREAVLSFRLKLVRKAMGLEPDDLKNEDGTGKLAIRSLRGRLLDIHGIAAWLRKHVKPGQYKLIIIDAYYRILPAEMSENDNNPTTQLYNLLDALSLELGCAFALVHHASKGSQTGKAVTDVGSGAGAMSRAADCHVVLRPHEEPGVIVKEVAVRSWPPVDPLCLRYIHPRWVVADGLDPAALKPEKAKTTINQVAERVWQCLKEHGPQVRAKIRGKLQISGDRCNEAVELLLLAKRIEPVDIPHKNGFHAGYQVTGTTLDNAGQSSSVHGQEAGAGLPKGKSSPAPCHEVQGGDNEQSSPDESSDDE